MLNIPLEFRRVPIITKITVISSFCLSLTFWILDYRAHWLAPSSLPESPAGTAGGTIRSATVPILTLVPSTSYYFVWTFVTSSFVSSNVFTLGISLATLLLGGRYLENSYSSRELLKFYAVVTLVPNLCLFTGLFLIFLTTRNTGWLESQIYGSTGIQAAILVAFKQLVPEHTVTLYKNLLKIRVKHFPALFILSIVLTAPLLGHSSNLSTCLLGFLSSWIYLRFYKSSLPDLGSHLITGTRGDASETFSLAQFFPDLFHGPIDRLASILFDSFVSAGICAPFGQDPTDHQHHQTNEFGHRITGSGIGRAEAERRRQKALAALDSKITRETVNQTQPGSTSLPPQVNH